MSHRPASDSSRTIFAVPKSVGTAVTRNRARRRVRAALQELQRDGVLVLGEGEYRVSVLSPLTTLSALELRATLHGLFEELRR
ncbi:MAG: ribonuclease P protein component [Acidimicrobiaceae bacterium]|nr:ribonuclease P protein component [Acidimicrobiaceae bacterium]